MSKDKDTGSTREFDLLMKHYGIDVPPELMNGSFAVYLELSSLSKILRQPRNEASEPSNIFILSSLLRNE